MYWGIVFILGMAAQADAELRFSADTFLSRSDVTIEKQPLNPQNQILELPHSKTKLEIRPEVKWRSDTWQTVLRPRFTWIEQQVQKNSEALSSTKGTLDLTDAFVENNWSSKFSTTVGLQVFQWGSAEFLNASNPFSHVNAQQKNLLFKEKGRGLVRANYSLNKENSLVFAVEPISNQEPEWIAQDQFVAKGFVKYEKSWSGTFRAVGLTFGRAEKNNFFIGEYFNYELTEGFSMYADFKQQKEQVHFIPRFNGVGYDMEEADPTENPWASLGVIGLRYEGSFDLRLEYIYNSIGYDRSELKNAIASASNFLSPRYPQNASRFFKPGLELIGRQYFYSSFRVTDPAWFQNFSFYLRYLYSLQDDSSQLQIEFEKSFFDAWTLYAGQNLNSFRSQTWTDISEFRLAQSNESFIGLKWSY